MNFGKCPVCREYTWLPHVCNPCFYVFWEGNDPYDYLKDNDDPQRYFAKDEEDAAVKYCEDASDLPDEIENMWVISPKKYQEIIDNSTEEDLDILRDIVVENCKKFSISSELTRNFYATEQE